MKNPAEDHPESSPIPSGGDAPVHAGGLLDEDTLWLVSFDDDDDRELRPSDIAAALRRGEIDHETIVWREGLDDWAPLRSISSLAQLLPSKGVSVSGPSAISPRPTREAPNSTATRTPLGHGPSGAPAKGHEPAKVPPNALADPARPENIGDAESATQPIVAAAPTHREAATTVDAWRGKTRLGLPTAPEVKRTATQTPLVSKKSGTPDAPRVGFGRTPDAPKVGTPKAGASIWDDEDDVPISVDPESIRPLSPTPNVVNATALARGTLGALPKKPPPRAPRPPGLKSAAPSPAGKPPPPRHAKSPAGTETPPIAALSHSSRLSERADETILNLGGGDGMSAALLAPPADLASAFGDEPVFRAESPPLDSPDVLDASDVQETATVPLATAVAPRAATPAPTGAPATPAGKKRGALPWVLGAGLVVVLVWIVAQKRAEPDAAPPPVAAPQEPAVRAVPGPAQNPVVAPESPVAPPPTEAPSTATPSPTTTSVVGSKSAGTAKTNQKTEPANTKPSPSESMHAATPAAGNGESAKKPEPRAASEPEPKQVDMGGDFDKSAASAALGAAAAQAASCRKRDDPAGIATVHVTFSNSGHATRATIEGPPFAGTATGGCIAAALRSAQVPPFGGDRVTVTKRVVIQ